MKMLSRAILVALAAVMIAGTIAYASGGHSFSPSTGTDASRVSASGAKSGADVKGPCEEAEHADDPRCKGVQVSEDNQRADDRNDDRGGINGHEGADDSENHSLSTVTSDDSSEHGTQLEAGDHSGRSREAEAGDDSSHHSGNSGPRSQDDGPSGRDHHQDD
jgi:hypothetical protein